MIKECKKTMLNSQLAEGGVNMRNIILYEQWKELYNTYLTIRPIHRGKDFTYKDGDLYVAITTNQRNYRQVTEGH